MGVACLNYAKPGTLAHHQKWAREHGFPLPSQAIFVLGLTGLSGGILIVGGSWLLGRSKPVTSPPPAEPAEPAEPQPKPQPDPDR